MAKRDAPISWRPSAEAQLALAELLKRDPKLKRSDILNRVVIEACHGPRQQTERREKLVMTSGGVKRQVAKQPKNRLMTPEKAVAGAAARLAERNQQVTGGVKRQQAIPKPAWKRE